MTNLQPQHLPDFPTPSIGLKGYRELTNRDIRSKTMIRIIRVKWSSLLGIDNEQLIEIALFNHANLIKSVKNTRKDFKSNYSDFTKYAKMDENEWK